MLDQVKGTLLRPLTTDSRDASVGSKLLYVAGLLMLVLGLIKVASLQLTEGQLVLGLLATICASMQMIVMGLLLEIRGRLPDRGMDQRPPPG